MDPEHWGAQRPLQALAPVTIISMHVLRMFSTNLSWRISVEQKDPSTWEDLATQRWQEYSQFSNETVDSTTGEILDPAKVKAGCDEELGFMSHMHVWDKVTREQAQSDPDGKIVGTRWVFVKKGDKVRCRLVAQEFAGSDKREDLYAGTPPLSATRYLLSDSVSRGRKNKRLKLWWST